jgi:hypothetical protein
VSTPVTTGETYQFAVAPERLRFFDADTGVRREPAKV